MFHPIFASRVFLGLGEDTRCRSKGEKFTTKGNIWENFLLMLFYIILYLCDPHYTLLYHQLYRYLVSLYQIIWTFTDPENAGFWETSLDKKKMLVISSFSCYYNVFYSTLTLSQTSPGLQYKSFENTLGKGEIARNEQFLLFPQCFVPFWITPCHCHQI